MKNVLVLHHYPQIEIDQRVCIGRVKNRNEIHVTR